MLTIQEIERIEMNANRTPAYRGVQLIALCNDWREWQLRIETMAQEKAQALLELTNISAEYKELQEKLKWIEAEAKLNLFE